MTSVIQAKHQELKILSSSKELLSPLTPRSSKKQLLNRLTLFKEQFLPYLDQTSALLKKETRQQSTSKKNNTSDPQPRETKKRKKKAKMSTPMNVNKDKKETKTKKKKKQSTFPNVIHFSNKKLDDLILRAKYLQEKYSYFQSSKNQKTIFDICDEELYRSQIFENFSNRQRSIIIKHLVNRLCGIQLKCSGMPKTIRKKRSKKSFDLPSLLT
ncbi:hypothetical protein M0812_27766 [Anaeramoeba flamelloides]|uniref:Uncharacterized protein n=1 Tax=Anaeramoeba flamelloides TaxID=1746091 RepID=A0AAV7YCR3_9EUKA|nr:hypothetical protein M0812_27766 [Anaeramoeba flamelloides]